MPGISDAVDHVAELLALLHERRPLTTVTAWPVSAPAVFFAGPDGAGERSGPDKRGRKIRDIRTLRVI